jgi:hypothetical protein
VYPRTIMSRTRMAVFALSGALIGAAMMFPMGTETIDGGPGCDCRSRTIILIGTRIRQPYPAWLPILAAMVGALFAVLLASLVARMLRRNPVTTPSAETQPKE